MTKIINLGGRVVDLDRPNTNSIYLAEPPPSPDSLTQNLSQNAPERSASSVNDSLLLNPNTFENHTQQRFAQIDPISGEMDNFNSQNFDSQHLIAPGSIQDQQFLNLSPIENLSNNFYAATTK